MLRALGVLLLAETLAYGVFAPSLGFYHDDWFLLETVSRSQGLLGAVKALAETGTFWSRPLLLVYFPLCLTLGGMNPFFYHVLMLSIDVLQGLLFYLLLVRLTGSKNLSLTAAALGLLAPSRAVTHVWFSSSPQGVALALVLGSLLLHARWSQNRRGLPWASQLLYFLSALTYESVVFLPLLLLGGLAARLRVQGRSWRKSLWEPVRDLSPYAATLGLTLAWQWFGMSALLSADNPKSVVFSPTHVLKAFGAGFECVTNRVVHMAWTSLIPVLRAAGPWFAALLIFAAAMAYLLSPGRGKDKDRRLALAAALGAAAAGFLGAYAPFALSGTYLPQIYGIMSRTNGAGALITGLLAAAGLYSLGASRPRLRNALLGILVAAFTWTDWNAGLEWKRSWTLQKDILDQASAKVRDLPEGSAVLLAGAPGYVGHAVVFDANYDFASALRLWSGRPDLKANIVSGRMKFDEKGAVEVMAGREGARYPYGRTYLFDYGADRLRILDGPPHHSQ